MLTVTIERFLAFTKENIAGVVEWPLVRGCLYDTRMTFIPVRVSFQSEVGSTAKGVRDKEKKHSKSEKVRTNNNYCSTMTLFHYHLNVLLIPYTKTTILSIIPYPLNYLSSYPSSLKALTGLYDSRVNFRTKMRILFWMETGMNSFRNGLNGNMEWNRSQWQFISISRKQALTDSY